MLGPRDDADIVADARDHVAGQPGRQLILPRAIGRRPWAGGGRIDQCRSQAASGGPCGQGATGWPSPDDGQVDNGQITDGTVSNGTAIGDRERAYYYSTLSNTAAKARIGRPTMTAIPSDVIVDTSLYSLPIESR